MSSWVPSSRWRRASSACGWCCGWPSRLLVRLLALPEATRYPVARVTDGHTIPTSGAVPLSIVVLGPLAVSRSTQPVTLKGRLRQLLTWLVLYRTDGVSCDRLPVLLWGDTPPARPDRQLQIVAQGLAQALAPSVVDVSPTRVRLRSTEVDVDADRFSDLVQGTGPDRMVQLSSALQLWRGTPYGEIADHLDAMAEVRRLEDLRLRALAEWHCLRLAAPVGPVAVVADLQGLVARHPDREHFRLLAAIGLAQAGRRVEALQVLNHLPPVVRR